MVPLFFLYCNWHTALPESRAESSMLKEQVEAQTKELKHWRERVDELEEKERVANENVGLLLFLLIKSFTVPEVHITSSGLDISVLPEYIQDCQI